MPLLTPQFSFGPTMKTGNIMKVVRKQTVYEGPQFIDVFPEPGKWAVTSFFACTESKLYCFLQM